MVKKQTGFQIASFLYPEEYFPVGGGSPKYGKIRASVESLQEAGWEVIDIRPGMVVQGEGTQQNINLLVSLVRYEWVEEPTSTIKIKDVDVDVQASLSKTAEDDEVSAKARRSKKDA